MTSRAAARSSCCCTASPRTGTAGTRSTSRTRSPCCAWTCAGTGESPRTAPYDLATLAADVRAVVDSLGAEEAPLVVGHSMGGVVATAYAHAHPVRGVINVDQALALGAMQVKVAPATRCCAATASTGSSSRCSARCTASSPARSPGSRRCAPPTRRRAGHVVAAAGPVTRPARGDRRRGTALPAGTRYLSLHGIDLGPDYAAWLTSVIPSAVVETWTPAGHYPHLAAPRRFVDGSSTSTPAEDAPPARPRPTSRQGSTSTTRKSRGPCTPSTRISSMSLVALGPEIQVSGR